MTNEELLEIAQALAETTPEDTDEMRLICDELHKARDLEDVIAAQQAADAKLAELERQVAALREPYRVRKAAANAVVAAATAALVRRIALDEQQALEAVQKRVAVPTPAALPKGLRATRKMVLASVNIDKLPVSCQKMVPDVEMILSRAEAGHDVPGATVEVKHGCVYTRPKR